MTTQLLMAKTGTNYYQLEDLQIIQIQESKEMQQGENRSLMNENSPSNKPLFGQEEHSSSAQSPVKQK